jgi:O-antigen/teichoic acid export membrane protein
VGFGFSKARLRTIAQFGYPLVLWFVANFVTVFSNRYFINNYVGPAGVGIYSLAAKFVFVISAFAFTPFQMIWDPQRFAIAKRDDALQIYSKVFLYMNLALAIMALGIGLLAFDTIRVIAAPAFRSAASVVPLLLAAQIVFHWTSFSNFGLFLRNKTHTMALLAGFGVVVVLALNFLFIPLLGIQGAAVAALVAYAIRFGSVYVLSQRQYRIDYPWASVVRLYLIVGLAVGGRQLVNHLPIAHSLLVSGSLAVASLSGVYAFVLTDTERGAIKRLLARPRLILSFGATRG